MTGSTYNCSISSAYSANACFRITVPFAARGKGLDGLVTMIVSLKILANVGPRPLASSITGLMRREVMPKARIPENSAYQIRLRYFTRAATSSGFTTYAAEGSMMTAG